MPISIPARLRTPLAVALGLGVAGLLGAFLVYQIGTANRRDDREAVAAWRAASNTIVARVQAEFRPYYEVLGGGEVPIERAATIRSELERARRELLALEHPSILNETVARFDEWLRGMIRATQLPAEQRAEIEARVRTSSEHLTAALSSLLAVERHLERPI